MSGPVTFSGNVGHGQDRRFRCLTGFIRPREQVGIIQRGTHRLVSANGRVIASLSSDRVNLFALEGRYVTVCGIDEGEIEGVISLRVTQVRPASDVVVVQPPPVQADLRLLLLLLLLQPARFGGLRQELLRRLLGGAI